MVCSTNETPMTNTELTLDQLQAVSGGLCFEDRINFLGGNAGPGGSTFLKQNVAGSASPGGDDI